MPIVFWAPYSKSSEKGALLQSHHVPSREFLAYRTIEEEKEKNNTKKWAIFPIASKTRDMVNSEGGHLFLSSSGPE